MTASSARGGVKRVVYVNHTAERSGAERSLLELLRGLQAEVLPVLACPEGALAEEARRDGIQVEITTGTDGSLKLHPRHTPQAILDLGRAALQLRRICKRVDADLMHANSIRAGLAAAATAEAGGPPAIVHVRDCLPPGRLSQLTYATLTAGCALFVANSAHTAESIRSFVPSADVTIVHNPVDLERFAPERIDRPTARRSIGLSSWHFALGVIAQITPWKDQELAIRALGLLRDEHPEARLLLAGSAKFVAGATRLDNVSYERGLHALIASLGLGKRVVFLGEREDVPEVIRALDVVLVPSWEEPFGRTVVEAMAMGVPVVATEVGGPSEIVVDGQSGRLLPPRRPEPWAAAIAELIDQPRLRGDLGAGGRQRSVDFSVPRHVEAVDSVYDRALAIAGVNGRFARARALFERAPS